MFADFERNKVKGRIINSGEIAGHRHRIPPISEDLKEIGEITEPADHHESANRPRKRIAMNETLLREGHAKAKNPKTSHKADFSEVNWIFTGQLCMRKSPLTDNVAEKKAPEHYCLRKNVPPQYAVDGEAQPQTHDQRWHGDCIRVGEAAKNDGADEAGYRYVKSFPGGIHGWKIGLNFRKVKAVRRFSGKFSPGASDGAGFGSPFVPFSTAGIRYFPAPRAVAFEVFRAARHPMTWRARTIHSLIPASKNSVNLQGFAKLVGNHIPRATEKKSTSNHELIHRIEERSAMIQLNEAHFENTILRPFQCA